MPVTISEGNRVREVSNAGGRIAGKICYLVITGDRAMAGNIIEVVKSHIYVLIRT